jgi:hypothetical protein
MKKTWSSLLALLLLAAPAAVQAQFTYTTTAANTLIITGYSGGAGVVAIPATIDGMMVTEIGTNAFAGMEVTSVTMSTNVISIDEFAFSECSNMTDITISENVTNIGTGAFGVCSSLTNVSIPAGVANLGNFAFILCTSLESIAIPSSVKSIGQAAFQNCMSLTNLTLANGINSIADDAFASCIELKSVTIPGSATNLGVDLFEACTGLLKADFGNGVTTIAAGMFLTCPNLNEVTIPASVTNIGEYAFAGTTLASVALPSGLISLGEYAFAGTALARVTFPAGLICIGNGAFSGTGIISVMIPASVTNIGPNVFSICSKLTNITVAAQNLFFSSLNGVLFDLNQDALLEYPDALGGAYLVPASVKNIAQGAFAGCSLASVTISAGVTNIGEDAFYGSSNLAILLFEGNAPTTDPTAFTSDLNATIYYLPGATGWSSPFAGLPAVLVEVVTWANPAPISYGAPLTTNELNAMSDVPGSFAYSPANGAILQPGTNTLSVVFTPSNTVTYGRVTNTVPLTVNLAQVAIVSGLTAIGKIFDRTATATLSSNNVVLSGVVAGDIVSLKTNGYAANFASAGVGNGIAVTVSGLTLSGAGAANYTLAQPTGLMANITAPTVRILASKPNIVISWPASATDYVLKQTPSLAPPVKWSPVTNSIAVNGTNNTVTINASSGAEYFGLVGTP